MLSLVAYIALLQSEYTDVCPTRAYLQGLIMTLGEVISTANKSMSVRQTSKSGVNCLCQVRMDWRRSRAPCGRYRV